MNPRTIIIADRLTRAIEWCQHNGVKPFSRRTTLATRGPVLRGLTITDADRVVDLCGATDEVYQDLAIADTVAARDAGAPITRG